MDYAALKPSALLQGLSDEQLREVWNAGKVVGMAAGEVIIAEGAVEDTMYILLEGSVEVSQTLVLQLGKRDFAEKEKTLIRLEANGRPCFGEMSLLEDAERSATVTALTDVTALVIARANFDEIVRKNPVLGCTVLRRIACTVSGRLRKANKDVLKLTTALSVALSA